MEPSSLTASRIIEICDEQDPWTRARLAGADILALTAVFDEAVGAIWTLHTAQRGAADVARSLNVPMAMLLGAITRATKITR